MFSSLKKLMVYSLCILVLGILVGWFISNQHTASLSSEKANTALRLGGYQFINPLLLCDTNFEKNSDSLQSLQLGIERFIDLQNLSNRADISVYLRKLNSGEEFSINPQSTFFPASIKKLPLMMQYYKEAETNTNLFSETGTFVIDKDINSNEIYPPKEALVSGNSYSIKQLIEFMIKYSDNNSFGVLYPYLGAAKADKIYEIMQLYFPNTYTSNDDYISAYQVSLFFRMLYNATYLSYDSSEKALKLLSEVDFSDGLKKNLPAGVTVSHKFGISADRHPDGKLYGELHDCGIIYKIKNPYLLCIMTKSNSVPVNELSDIIAKIALMTYNGK